MATRQKATQDFHPTDKKVYDRARTAAIVTRRLFFQLPLSLCFLLLFGFLGSLSAQLALCALSFDTLCGIVHLPLLLGFVESVHDGVLASGNKVALDLVGYRRERKKSGRHKPVLPACTTRHTARLESVLTFWSLWNMTEPMAMSPVFFTLRHGV